MAIVISFLAAVAAFFMARKFARSTMNDFTSACVTLGVATVTWNAVKIGFPVGDLFFLVAAVPVFFRLVGERVRAPLPLACLIGIGFVTVAILLNALFPVSQDYSLGRYVVGTGNVALTEAQRVFGSIFVGIKMEVALAIMPLAVMAVTRTRERLSTLVDLWAMSSLANAFVALVDAAHLTHINNSLVGSLSTAGGREGGLTNHPNHLATVLVMGIPIVLSWWRRGGNWRRASVGGTILLAAGINATGSRGGLAVGALIVVVASLTQPSLRRALATIAVPAAFALGAVFVLDSGLIHSLLGHTRFGSSTGSGSDAIRKAVAEQAIRDIEHRPLLGVGFDVADQGHSIYLQAIAAGGVVTLIGLAIYISGVIRTTQIRVAGKLDAMVVATLVSLLGWLILGGIENDFADRYPYVPMAMLLAAASIRMADRAPAEVSEPVLVA